MRLLKCDRCGEIYPATNIDKPRATVAGYSGEVDKEWDLCLSCGRAVKHFLNEAPPTASTK